MRNRLNLNFQLEGAQDRVNYVNQYLNSIKFIPTEAELETISNYILWGKNEKGLNPQQEKFIELKKWATIQTDSLEELIESPGFQETSIHTLREPQQKKQRTVFDRQKAIQNSPPHLQAVYEDLFRQIDTIELTLNYYELFCGRRELPPREKLLSRFSEEEQRSINEKAIQLTQYKYLKLKRLLVELRAEQYTYYDTNNLKIHSTNTDLNVREDIIEFSHSHGALPLNFYDDTVLAKKIFFDKLDLNSYTEEDLRQISELIWRKPEEICIDFRNIDHLLQLYKARADLHEAISQNKSLLRPNEQYIINTLQYYENKADLTPLQKDILEQKINKQPNILIAEDINKRYGKNYSENYISTLFHKKILQLIAGAALQHWEIIQNIFYPENFKKCKDCGLVLLMNTDNFMRQQKSKDGFAPRCKKCAKIKRDKYYETHR